MRTTFTKNGVDRTVKVGFSWTVLFFGPFTFMWRGMWGHAALCWIVAMFTLGLSSFVFPFIANRMYGRWLAERGWKTWDKLPASWGIY